MVDKTVQSVENQLTFWRNMSPPSSGLESNPSHNHHEAASEVTFYVLFHIVVDPTKDHV
jgi:hypothetical protein